MTPSSSPFHTDSSIRNETDDSVDHSQPVPQVDHSHAHETGHLVGQSQSDPQTWLSARTERQQQGPWGNAHGYVPARASLAGYGSQYVGTHASTPFGHYPQTQVQSLGGGGINHYSVPPTSAHVFAQYWKTTQPTGSATFTSATASANTNPPQYLILCELPQNLYINGQPAENPLPTLYFNKLWLRDALFQNFHTLPGFDRPAWPDTLVIPQKLAIRICVPDRREYNRQVNVRGGRNHTKFITTGQLASLIAHEVQQFLNSEPNGALQLSSGRLLTVNDLVLMEVRHVSKGSLQPVLGFYVPQPAYPGYN